MKRTATRLVAMVAATAAAMVLATAPSFAHPTTATATTSAGYGYFNGETQIIAVHDSHKDGKGVAILYYRYDLAKTGPYYAWNQTGSGTTTYLHLHMPSNTTIKMYACPEDEGIVINYECGSAVFATVPI